jgi:hypothetical protein
MSLEEPLIHDRDSNEQFGIGKEDLMKLFEKENRSSDHGGVCESSAKLHKLGGVAGLMKALDSGENNGIDDTQSEIKKREKAFGSNERREVKTRGICEMI